MLWIGMRGVCAEPHLGLAGLVRGDTSNGLLEISHISVEELRADAASPFDSQAAAAAASTSDAPIAAKAVPAAVATEGLSLPHSY
jgi:hypothetical protein